MVIGAEITENELNEIKAKAKGFTSAVVSLDSNENWTTIYETKIELLRNELINQKTQLFLIDRVKKLTKELEQLKKTV